MAALRGAPGLVFWRVETRGRQDRDMSSGDLSTNRNSPTRGVTRSETATSKSSTPNNCVNPSFRTICSEPRIRRCYRRAAKPPPPVQIRAAPPISLSSLIGGGRLNRLQLFRGANEIAFADGQQKGEGPSLASGPFKGDSSVCPQTFNKYNSFSVRR